MNISILYNPFLAIFNFRRILVASVTQELRQKYKGSAFGLLWALIYPLCLFCIYTTLYLFVFRIKPTDMGQSQYIIYIMSGLIPFLSFSEALSAGTASLYARKQLLLNTVFPSEYIPLQTVLSSHINLFVGAFLLIIASLMFFKSLPITIIFLPLVMMLQVMFVTGLVWYLSLMNLVLKDIQQSLSLVVMMLMILSPIAYTPSMVPRAFKFIIWINPFSYFVRAYQEIYIYAKLGVGFYVATALALIMFYSGYYFFCKVKRVFHDYV